MSKIVCINICFNNPTDELHPWKKRVLLLNSIIQKHSPFLLGTQEGRHEQIQDLSQLLPDYQIVDQHRNWIAERMYPNIFIKRESGTILESGDIWLSQTPKICGSLSFGSKYPRLCIWAKIQFTFLSKPILVVNTHIDHLSHEVREQQIEVLLIEIGKLGFAGPMIIMGDFNEAPELSVHKKILSHFGDMHDPWITLKRPEETSHHDFKGSFPNGHRIDWIFLSKNFEVETISLDKTKEENLYPSDHFPVVCSLKI